ncbi:MAG TPA: class I SAM-dependent methyltransferase [Mariniphaga anaerophila]|uniref:Class I SAM-dependent methyltransferase n=1 Tax=Mariniphaga anaerophila TaxID=1484053 RepID=A0A831LSL9_9BACT|nr:class I SAM-dependent methyltransferase [Mariniphaga anaerophila]
MEVCPLCYTESFQPEIVGPKNRFFHLCENCKLVFEEKSNQPSRDEEKERYLEHDNGIQYEGYVNHLNQAIKPALKYLQPDFRGLDYGCGPVPTLNILVEQEGFACEFYDPIFFPEYPMGTFDFIFATECFEHFFRPEHELQKLENLIKPGGILVVMTQLWKDTAKFKGWRYAHDPTHVVFYHENTFRFMSTHYGYNILEIKKDRVVILQKKQ